MIYAKMHFCHSKRGFKGNKNFPWNMIEKAFQQAKLCWLKLFLRRKNICNFSFVLILVI